MNISRARDVGSAVKKFRNKMFHRDRLILNLGLARARASPTFPPHTNTSLKLDHNRRCAWKPSDRRR